MSPPLGYHVRMSNPKPPKPSTGLRKLVHIVKSRSHLFICATLGAMAAWALPYLWEVPTVTRLIVGWNLGAWTYLALALRVMFGSTHANMRSRAISQDEGRLLILAMVVLAAIAVLAAIVGELAMAKGLHGGQRYDHVALAASTLLSSWAFTQLMFAQHYAHDYYIERERGNPGGLDFPNEDAPDYGDFLYFACIIGTSAQTADVSFTSRTMRRTGLVHCILAFFFNATLLALTINIASGLF